MKTVSPLIPQQRLAPSGPGRSSIAQLLAHARSRFVRLAPREADRAVRLGALLVDIRAESQRRRDGEIPDALVIDRTVFEWRLDPLSPSRIEPAVDRRAQVVVICDQGFSSSLAAATLLDMGFARATDVIGGVEAWRAAGLPLLRVDPTTDGICWQR